MGLSQADLASRMGTQFTEELIAGYESGVVPMEATRVLELMKALGITGDAMNPRRLLADSFVRTGYCTLTDDLREVVDQLASSLAKVETETKMRSMTQKEIGQELGIAQSTVSDTIRRGIDHLRSAMSGRTT